MFRVSFLIPFIFFAVASRAQVPAKTYTLPSTVIEEWRISPQPNNVSINENPDFPAGATTISVPQRYCMFNPHQKLQAGAWYWKYDILEGTKTTIKGTYSFTIAPDATGIETPAYAVLKAAIGKGHFRIKNLGENVEKIRSDAPSHPLYKKILETGQKAIGADIYRGPVEDKSPATSRKLTGIGNKEVDLYNSLLETYILSDDEAMLNALKERTDVLANWPTDDLLGSRVLMAFSLAYDCLYDSFSETTRQSILKVIDHRLKEGLQKWPGVTEARHVDNHFWQLELTGNFIAALATINELPAADEMLQYTYELFIARFPNLATLEGGWAEGIGYFGVNKPAFVDMALLPKKINGADVFKMNWYKNLADYFIYFAPADGRISGFGDMHERVGNGNTGQEMMLIEGEENQDVHARYRLAQLLQSARKNNNSKGSLNRIEPWYQIVNNIRFNADKVPAPQNLSPGKVFYGTGEVAFHSDVLNTPNNTALFFRSSPVVAFKSRCNQPVFLPVIDFKKKFNDTPDQYHISYTSTSKSGGMRFLTIIQLNDAGKKVAAVTKTAPGEYNVGDVIINAGLNTAKPAMLTVRAGESVIYINTGSQKAGTVKPEQKTVLIEKGNIQSCYNLPIPYIK